MLIGYAVKKKRFFFKLVAVKSGLMLVNPPYDIDNKFNLISALTNKFLLRPSTQMV